MSENYVQFSPVPYAAVRMDVLPMVDENNFTDYAATAQSLAEAWAALMEAFPAVEPAPAPAANGRPAAPAQASRGSGGAGGQRNAWPPTVVATRDDNGEATVGCSYHKGSADRGGGPRPMRDFGDDGFKCTAKSTRDGNDNGYCPLRYQPVQQQTSVPLPQGMPDEDPLDPDNLPFHHPPSLDS